MSKQIFFVATLIFTPLAAVSNDDLLQILDDKVKSEVAPEVKYEAKAVRILPRLLPNPNAEQVIFLNFLKNADYEKALFQWPEAFGRTEFEKSASGQALWAYLLYKNELAVNGVETLFKIREPQKLDKDLAKLWSETVAPNSWIWHVADLEWQEAWSPIFGDNVEVVIRSKFVKPSDQLERTEKLLKKTQPDTMERAWIEWQYALGLIQHEEVGKAAKILKHLVDSKVKMVGSDHLHMTAGRLLYEKGYLDAAVEYFDKVSKSSDFWIEAQEEAAWSYMRKGEPQNAIARLTSIMNPIFKNEVGPETVYLNALAHLKVCDYPAVVQTITEFKTRFKPRAQVLEEVQTSVNADVLFSKLKSNRITLKELGPAAKSYPRLVTRDELTFQNAQKMHRLKAEAAQAEALYARSLAGGSSRVGFVARFADLKSSVLARSRAAETQALSRIKQLATNEREEIKQMLQKMQVVEAEVIQQIQMAGRVEQAGSKGISDKQGKILAKAQDTLQFPAEKEVWLDEISHYKLDLKKACQSIKR